MDGERITKALAGLIETAAAAAHMLKTLEDEGYLSGDALGAAAVAVRQRLDAGLAGVVAVGEAEPDPISYSNG